MEPLSKRLKRFRSDKGLSVAIVAKKIGVSESTYRDWEYGRDIRGEPYVKMAEVFGVSLSSLLLGAKAERQALAGKLDEVADIINFIRSHI